MSNRERIEPGDVFEIKTQDGPVLVQVTHLHPTSSEVVRVLATTESAPADLDELARQEPCLVAMVPFASAIGSGRLSGRKIGRAAVPEEARAFPTFRMPILDKKEGVRANVAYWWFWDGEGLTYDAEPPAETESFPLREVLSIDAFLSRLRKPGA